ncbi:MAG TPA: TIGR03621 family F420-dependent LLM class oxidoreductase [Ktedonobacterales bacterium]|nr:TIGR03621 family F420-dependent LLM class oxidoreductase [Ktedonobacterales bacterium]
MAEARAFRFGAGVTGAGSRAEWVALARRIEELGYAVLLVPDHFDELFQPSVALMAAADAAPHLRIGSYVYDNDFRHPALLAKEAALLDLLSDGRLELGIGAGWNLADYEQTGLPFESAGIRIERLAEAITILRQFFTQESVTFAGKYYQVTGLEGRPKPVQQPHPPIFIGGGGQRVLTLAGQQADIVGLHFKVNADNTVDADERLEGALARKVEWVRAAAGERFAAIELNLLLSGVIVTDDREQAADERARQLQANGSSVTANVLLESPYWLIGSVDEMVERLVRLRATLGISYVVAREDVVEAFAPVVARLAGQ